MLPSSRNGTMPQVKILPFVKLFTCNTLKNVFEPFGYFINLIISIIRLV